MGKLGEGTMYPKVGAVCMVLALLLYLISFGAPHWAHTNTDVVKRKEHIGLWKFCSNPINGGEACSDFIDFITGDWLKACQSFMTLALFALLGGVAATAMTAVPNFEGDTKILLAAIVVDAVAFFFLITGIGIWAGKYERYFVTRDPDNYDEEVGQLGWAFGVACTSCILTFLAILTEVAELIMGGDEY